MKLLLDTHSEEARGEEESREDGETAQKPG
jgi:hypothetical protein